MAISKIQLSNLLDVYGGLLTDKQRDAISMYCDCDCSLAEIALEVGISRQGVRDAIVNGEKSLEKLEETLHICAFLRDISIAVENNDDQAVVQIAKKFVDKE